MRVPGWRRLTRSWVSRISCPINWKISSTTGRKCASETRMYVSGFGKYWLLPEKHFMRRIRKPPGNYQFKCRKFVKPFLKLGNFLQPSRLMLPGERYSEPNIPSPGTSRMSAITIHRKRR